MHPINDLDNKIGSMSLNLAKGYDIADRILRQNRVLYYKVELPGKQIVNGTKSTKTMVLFI